MNIQRLTTQRMTTALKVLAVLLVIGLTLGVATHKAYAATPTDLPVDVENDINSYNSQPQTQNLYFDDSWLSVAGGDPTQDQTDTNISYGQPSVALQVNELIFLYQSLVNGGTGLCPGNGGSIPCDGT